MFDGNDIQEFSCKICFEKFSRKWRYPVSLHCGHTICRICARKVAGNENYIQCCFCREITNSNWAKLAKNLALCEILEGINLLENDENREPTDEEILANDLMKVKLNTNYERTVTRYNSELQLQQTLYYIPVDGQSLTIVIRKGTDQRFFGFAISSELFRHSHIVTKIEHNSSVLEAGLKLYDIITHVNAQPVQNLSQSQLVQLIRSSGNELTLRILRGQIGIQQ